MSEMYFDIMEYPRRRKRFLSTDRFATFFETEKAKRLSFSCSCSKPAIESKRCVELNLLVFKRI